MELPGWLEVMRIPFLFEEKTLKTNYSCLLVVTGLAATMAVATWAQPAVQRVEDYTEFAFYTPSPNGQKITFLEIHYQEVPTAQGFEPLCSSRAVMKVGTIGKTETLDFLPATFTESWGAANYYDYVWRPDSKALAVRAGRDLWLMDATTGELTDPFPIFVPVNLRESG